MRISLGISFAVILLLIVHSLSDGAGDWENLDQGLDYGKFKVDVYAVTGDSVIHVLRINPKYWDFKLLCASELTEGKRLSVKVWCDKYQLTAGINAGMYDVDMVTHIGYLGNYQHVNNALDHPKYHSMAAFNPKSDKYPSFKTFDAEAESLSAVREKYHSIMQNLRLIKRPRKNRWEQQTKKWSEAALGEDKHGNALFIFSRSPYSMHDFNNLLLELPIDIVSAQHLEGGTEAQIYIDSGDFELDLTGSFETGFLESGSNSYHYPVPNVIGIKKKE